jgi:HD-like signal output (HDOD) protein
VTSNTAEHFVRNNEKVYALARNFFAIHDALNDPDKSFREIGLIIGCDAAFSAKLLKAVNSPFFGFDRKIETLDHAIALIGTEPLADMLFATAVIRNFRGIPHDFFNEDMFWKHSVACGILAKHLARFHRREAPTRYYLMGVLHDLGRALLCVREPTLMSALLRLQGSGGQDLAFLEREQLGFDHAEIGAVLLELWGLSPLHVESTRWHHRPEEAIGFQDDVLILAVADALTHELGFSTDNERGDRAFPEDGLKLLSVEENRLPPLKNQVERELTALMELVQ